MLKNGTPRSHGILIFRELLILINEINLLACLPTSSEYGLLFPYIFGNSVLICFLDGHLFNWHEMESQSCFNLQLPSG